MLTISWNSTHQCIHYTQQCDSSNWINQCWNLVRWDVTRRNKQTNILLWMWRSELVWAKGLTGKFCRFRKTLKVANCPHPSKWHQNIRHYTEYRLWLPCYFIVNHPHYFHRKSWSYSRHQSHSIYVWNIDIFTMYTYTPNLWYLTLLWLLRCHINQISTFSNEEETHI